VVLIWFSSLYYYILFSRLISLQYVRKKNSMDDQYGMVAQLE